MRLSLPCLLLPRSRGHTAFFQACSISNSSWSQSFQSLPTSSLLTHCSPTSFGRKVPKLNHKGTRTHLRPQKGFSATKLCRQGCPAMRHSKCILWLRLELLLAVVEQWCCTQLWARGMLPKASGDNGLGEEGNKAKKLDSYSLRGALPEKESNNLACSDGDKWD